METNIFYYSDVHFFHKFPTFYGRRLIGDISCLIAALASSTNLFPTFDGRRLIGDSAVSLVRNSCVFSNSFPTYYGRRLIGDEFQSSKIKAGSIFPTFYGRRLIGDYFNLLLRLRAFL